MDVPEALRAWANRPQGAPLEEVRGFLRAHVADAESLDEVRADLTRLAEVNARTVRRYLEAVEAVLADPPPEGELARLVGWDANWVLDDPSDAGAAAWLRGIAELISQVLAQGSSTG